MNYRELLDEAYEIEQLDKERQAYINSREHKINSRGVLRYNLIEHGGIYNGSSTGDYIR